MHCFKSCIVQKWLQFFTPLETHFVEICVIIPNQTLVVLVHDDSRITKSLRVSLVSVSSYPKPLSEISREFIWLGNLIRKWSVLRATYITYDTESSTSIFSVFITAKYAIIVIYLNFWLGNRFIKLTFADTYSSIVAKLGCTESSSVFGTTLLMFQCIRSCSFDIKIQVYKQKAMKVHAIYSFKLWISENSIYT